MTLCEHHGSVRQMFRHVLKLWRCWPQIQSSQRTPGIEVSRWYVLVHTMSKYTLMKAQNDGMGCRQVRATVHEPTPLLLTIINCFSDAMP